jgi:dTDP-4-amino-4,6-dideoxygalactose transaminase
MKIPYFAPARALDAIAEQVNASVLEVVHSGGYILGKHVAALEEEVADYLGTAHAVAVNSGTDALHLALAGLGVGPGDEVITSPYTFAATLEAIEYVGAQAVLVDIDADTYNIDADRIEAAITGKTKAILPIHMFGLPADMPRIMAIAEQHELKVVEDCAQSFGASIGGHKVGAIGDCGAHSFYPTKTLGCLGDGGMVSVQDADVARRMRVLRNHGIGDGGEHVCLGFNSRLDEVQAAVLRIKLGFIDASNDRRREIATRYNDVLSKAGATTPGSFGDAHHVYGYYTMRIDNRDDVRARLGEAGVATAVYYMKPLHRHEHFGKTCRWDSLEVAEGVGDTVISLPVFPEMSDEEVDYVASTTASLLA